MVANTSLENFQQQARKTIQAVPDALQTGNRSQAREAFLAHGLPTRKTENWRYTSILPLTEASYWTQGRLPEALLQSAVTDWRRDHPETANRVVIANGDYQADLSDPMPSGVRIRHLSQMPSEQSLALFQQPDSAIDWGIHPFASMNAALVEDPLVIEVDADCVLEQAIHLVHLNGSASGDFGVTSRILVITHANSQANVTEHHLSLQPAGEQPAAAGTSNTLVEFRVGEGAKLEASLIQHEAPQSLRTHGLHVQMDKNSQFQLQHFCYASRLLRNDICVRLSGPGGECSINGLYLVNDDQHVDNHVTIDHLAPHCTSNTTYRGMADGAGRGVFNGRIHIKQDAQVSDAKLKSDNLLLSAEAEIDTKPELEIYADDVKCAHGATVGSLSQEEIFYLQSRGLDADLAARLLSFGFASEILQHLKDNRCREEAVNWLLDFLDCSPSMRELLLS